MGKSYTVGQVAEATHVTVRTLHHYDEIGLLSPSRRGRNGYRHYTQDDLRRLQRILVLRELGFTLDGVRALLAGDADDLRRALVEQRTRLARELEHTAAVLRAIEVAIESQSEGEETMEKLFDGHAQFEHLRYEEEARARWGHTEAYAESARRTRQYGTEDWAQMKQEADAIMRELAAALRAGKAHDEPSVRALVERHRAHIDRWFYPCDRVQHAHLAALYVGDPRFAAYFERYASGLSTYVAAAIDALRDDPASDASNL